MYILSYPRFEKKQHPDILWKYSNELWSITYLTWRILLTFDLQMSLTYYI